MILRWAIITTALAIASASAAQGPVPEKIRIPAGEATVGADMAEITAVLAGGKGRAEWYKDETPKRKIKTAGFFIDKIEVTNERYKAAFPDHIFPPNLAKHPAVNVTWAKAKEFCGKAGGGLPREEEFERAARGDDGRIYPWGNAFDPDKAVFMGSTGASRLKVGSFEKETTGENMMGGTSPAGSRPQGASPYGVLDMAGNVWEWQDGWYDEKKKLRLLKGGSWLTPQASLRPSARLGDDGARLFNDYGFRCVYPAGQ
jgi:iron(II)-dependent oxidoreductase